MNFSLLTADICCRVWGTPANFNGFRVLATLLHGTLVVGVRQTLLRWTEGATYIRQCGYHVGHWPTFLVSECNGELNFAYEKSVSCIIVTRWNLQACPKLPDRSQPLVGRSPPYYEDMWRTCCCLTRFFSDCRYVAYLRRYSPTKLCDGVQMAIFGDFLRPVFSASSVQHVSDLRLKFALRPHHVWKYGRHPISDRWG